MPSELRLPTLGVIAEQLREPIHRIRYIVDTRGIRPTARAGNAKIFADGDVERIRVALAEIARAKEVGHGRPSM
jgi:hypothetical protein